MFVVVPAHLQKVFPEFILDCVILPGGIIGEIILFLKYLSSVLAPHTVCQWSVKGV